MDLRTYINSRKQTTVKTLAADLGTSRQNVYNWMKFGATIHGKPGERIVTLTRVLADERNGEGEKLELWDRAAVDLGMTAVTARKVIEWMQEREDAE